MSQATPYQWLCLRNVKPGRRLNPSITKRNTSTGPIQNPSTPSRETITAFLQDADDQYLAQTQRHLNTLRNSISTTKHALATVIQAAGTIQVDPEISPYNLPAWRKHATNVPAQVAQLEAHASRIYDNLTDLRSIPYPNPTSATEKFRDEIHQQSGHQKVATLQWLKWQQTSQENRMKLAIRKLEDHVRAFEKLKERRMQNSFRKRKNGKAGTESVRVSSHVVEANGPRESSNTSEADVDAARAANHLTTGRSNLKRTPKLESKTARSRRQSLSEMQRDLEAQIQA